MTKLPPNWRDKARILHPSHPQTKEYTRRYGETGIRIWVEDDCPLQPGTVVVGEDKKGRITVFLLNDGPVTIMPRSWN